MDIPLRSPPPGVNSNFDNPQFLGAPVLVSAGIGLPLVLIFAAIRIYAQTVVRKSWRADDYVYFLCCAFGIAMIAFSISIVFTGPDGYHAWDINKFDMTKGSIMSMLAFWIALGPIFWFLKVALFSFILVTFGSTRWVKNCSWIGIIVTGLVFSTYTIVVTQTCGPTPDSDTASYINGLDRAQCTSSSGANAVVSSIASIINGISNIYLLLISLPLAPTLDLLRKQMRGVYIMHLAAAIVCICSLVGVVFRIKSWQTNDVTGAQIPFYTAFVLEISLTLIIPCMPSVWTVYRHFTVPDIDDTTTIATPNMKLLSNASSPQTESRATWRKTHQNIEEIPYRKASSEYSSQPGNVRTKALPRTPLPLALRTAPSSPKSPASFKSMNLPIMFHTSSNS